MLFFVGTRFHLYTLHAPVETGCGGHGVWVVPVSYDDLFSAAELPGGTYIFTDIERLSPHERLLAAAVYRLMAAHPLVFRPINDPARVRVRFALLRALREAGLNDFDAYQASGQPRPRRFPVFVKSVSNHEPMVTDLLPDQAALDQALDQLEAAGQPLDSLVVIEFAGEPVAPGVWVRYTAFRIGDDVLLDLAVTEGHWMVKSGDINLGNDVMYQGHDAMLREGRDVEVLKQAFDLARIDYGRLDYGLVGGRPQIYEINTNPNVPGPHSRHPNAIRQATRQFAWERLTARLATLADGHGAGQSIPLDLPLLADFQRESDGARMSWRP